MMRRVVRRTDGDRGSTIPLMIGFFIVAGLLLTGGVVASAAFLAQRELQAGCDGAAVAGATGFTRIPGAGDGLAFDNVVGRAAIADYLQQTWGADAAGVDVTIDVTGDRVVLTCSRTAHVPFEAVFAPDGIRQTTTASADAPLSG